MPRYHIAGVAGKFFERQPYRNHQVLMETSLHATRFIALGKFGDKAEKHVYAFSIVPMKFLDRVKLIEQHSATTECPYGNVVKILQEEERIKREKSERGKNSGQFFFDFTPTEEEEEKGGHSRPHGRKRRGGDHHHEGHQDKKPQGPCWFCLSSPEVEKHLVVSVGDAAYLALAKGGLTPDHLLILPIDHIQSLAVAPDDLLEEINKYKGALRKYFRESGRDVLFFERNFRTQHCQVQAVPVPESCLSSIAETMLRLGDTAGLELAEFPPETQINTLVNEGVPYFWADLPPDGKHIFCRISSGKRFPLQFGREVASSKEILNCPQLVDWKNCASSKEKETENADNFKVAFRNFDFTIED